jgi:hypothetical protein
MTRPKDEDQELHIPKLKCRMKGPAYEGNYEGGAPSEEGSGSSSSGKIVSVVDPDPGSINP